MGGGRKTRVAFPGSTGKLSSEVRYFGYVSGKLPTYPFPNINTYFYARNMLSVRTFIRRATEDRIFSFSGHVISVHP